MKRAMAQVLGLVCIIWSSSQAIAASGLCEDLAAFSCAPGTYDDGTGIVRDPGEVEEQISEYAEKTKKSLRTDLAKVIADPENSFFRESALGALGLKDSPQCASGEPADIQACDKSAVAGLVVLAQRQVFGSMANQGSRLRVGNVQELMYITQNDKFVGVIDKYKGQAEKDLHSRDVINKVENKVFPKVRALIAERINAMPIPDQQKKHMIGKIKGINFKGSDCGMNYPGSKSDVSSLLIPNAFYEPLKNTFKFCGGLLFEASSEFTLAMVVAHELSHSIDPCNVGQGPANMAFKYSSDKIKKMEREYPFSNVISCLRGSDSIGARNFDQDPLPQTSTYMCPSCSISTPGTSATLPKNPNFCANDQIGESFSDWVAAEVIPEYMEKNHKLTTKQYQIGYANTERILCAVQPEMLSATTYGGYSAPATSDVHPDARDRVNKILLSNPKVRQQMGCPEKNPKAIYCDSNEEISSNKTVKTKGKNQEFQGGAR